MAIDLSDTICRAPDLMTAPVDDDLVILAKTSSSYVALESIGQRVLELVQAPIRVDDLCRRLSQEFDATPEQIAADIQPFLTDLKAEGIVDVVGQRYS
jgi:hypothetical protein